MKKPPLVLICDDDETFHLAVKYSLKGKYECRSAKNGDEALLLLKKEKYQFVLLDIQMRTPTEGLEVLPKIKNMQDDADIIMTSGLSDFSTVREAMRLGATDYVPKDFDPTELAITMERVTERRRLLKTKEHTKNEIVRDQVTHHSMIGESKQLEALRVMISRARNSDANILITGETGSGKEVIARQLRGNNEDGDLIPFIAVDSSTIQSSTAESRLFGHEKGAFTGADQSTKGFFEEANGGIIYFDEIANMPLDIQSKLLRAIQEQEITRLGSTRVIQLQFRVVAATNRDLEEMSKKGEFKYDLFQRLNVIPISVPPLRDRKDDIKILVHHFIAKSKRRQNLIFSDDALELLKQYDWPGNIRELGNVVSYVSTMAPQDHIEIADLPPWLRDKATQNLLRPTTQSDPGPVGMGYYAQVQAFERRLLSERFKEQSGNISKLALDLGMDRSHLYSKLKEFGIYQPNILKK